ncbi:MAG TPA: hypothetical protein VGA67_02355 [Candidatus Dojkabacteria bacterium]
MFGVVSAIQSYPQGSVVEIKHPVRVDGGIPASALCNISVYNPHNTTLLVNFLGMTNSGDYFNYTLNTSQTTTKGIYNYDITCESAGLNATNSFQFLINLGGTEPTEQRTSSQTRTIAIFFVLGILSFIAIFFVKMFPIKITMFLIMIWFFLIGINLTYLSIQDELVNTSMEGFFSFFLVVAFYSNYFIFISIAIIWILTFFTTFLEKKRQKKEDRYG